MKYKTTAYCLAEDLIVHFYVRIAPMEDEDEYKCSVCRKKIEEREFPLNLFANDGQDMAIICDGCNPKIIHYLHHGPKEEGLRLNELADLTREYGATVVRMASEIREEGTLPELESLCDAIRDYIDYRHITAPNLEIFGPIEGEKIRLVIIKKVEDYEQSRET